MGAFLGFVETSLYASGEFHSQQNGSHGADSLMHWSHRLLHCGFQYALLKRHNAEKITSQTKVCETTVSVNS